MTSQQTIGMLALLVGVAWWMKQRGLCVLCRPDAPSPTTGADGGLIGLDLYPEQPSLAGVWPQMLIAELDSDRMAGNAPGDASISPSRPTAVTPIPNLQPSVDDYMPPNPVNPDLSASIENLPELDTFNMGGSFESVAWTVAPSTEVVAETDLLDEFFSPGG